MPTSRELVAQKREREAWDAYMAGLRAAEAARVAQQSVQPPATETETASAILGPDGEPITPEPSDG